MNYRYKKAGVWLCQREDWQYREWIENNYFIDELPQEVQDWWYNKHPISQYPQEYLCFIEGLADGIVDCITFGSLMAYAFEDYDVLEVHTNLLQQGIRWPEVLTPPGKPNMRSIRSMTRDPFIAHWFACVKLNRPELIATTPVTWWLRRRYLDAWFRYVTAKEEDRKDRNIQIFEKNLLRLIWWGKHTQGIRDRLFQSRFGFLKQLHHRFGINGYSLHLWSLLANVLGTLNLRHELYQHIPDWNLFCRELVRCGSVSEDDIYDYVPQRRYQWGEHEKLPEEYELDPEDEYPLDKKLLLKKNRQLTI